MLAWRTLVDVVELVGAVVRWNRELIGHLVGERVYAHGSSGGLHSLWLGRRFHA